MLSLLKFTLMQPLIAILQTVHNSFKGNISIDTSQQLAEVLQQKLINEQTVIVMPESPQSGSLQTSQTKIERLNCIIYYAPIVQH